MMSIPRDLKSKSPASGPKSSTPPTPTAGPKLTLQVVKELTGLKINHVVNVDFLGFVHAVDAIGCVYTDVDRRYYHSNDGVPASEQYSEINIQPGYQKLCGEKALEYVRYRHTDTDIVRSAAPAGLHQPGPQPGLARGPDLRPARPDRHLHRIHHLRHRPQRETMLEVLNLFIASRNAAIKEVHFPAELGPSFVTATPEAIHEAVKKFLGSEASGGPRGSLEGRGTTEESAKTRQEEARETSEERTRKRRSRSRTSSPSRPATTAWSRPSKPAKLEGKTAAARVGGGFPIYYPTRLPSGAYFAESNAEEHVVDPRVYHLRDNDEDDHAAYRMVGVWEAPRRHPLLRGPGDPRLGRPADPRRPDDDRDDPPPRIRNLHRQRPDQDDRLAPRRKHLLDLQRPAADADQRTDDRHRHLDQGDPAEERSASTGGEAANG